MTVRASPCATSCAGTAPRPDRTPPGTGGASGARTRAPSRLPPPSGHCSPAPLRGSFRSLPVPPHPRSPAMHSSCPEIGRCLCGASVFADSFRDRESYLEFYRTARGLCQACQDSIFLGENPDEPAAPFPIVDGALAAVRTSRAGAAEACLLPFRLVAAPQALIAWEARFIVRAGPALEPLDPWRELEPMRELLDDHQVRVSVAPIPRRARARGAARQPAPARRARPTLARRRPRTVHAAARHPPGEPRRRGPLARRVRARAPAPRHMVRRRARARLRAPRLRADGTHPRRARARGAQAPRPSARLPPRALLPTARLSPPAPAPRPRPPLPSPLEEQHR